MRFGVGGEWYTLPLPLSSPCPRPLFSPYPLVGLQRRSCSLCGCCRNTRVKEMLPHPSFDVDGDGWVGNGHAEQTP